MNNSTQTRVTRFAMALSAAAVTTLAACSDSTSPTALRSTGSTASFDHGGVSGNSGPGNGGNDNQGNLNQGDQNQGNQNQGNQNDQRARTIIALVAPAAGAPFAAAHGKAQLDTRVGETELELEVEHVPAGTVVNFFIGATKVGSATAGAFGEAEVELNSRRGDIIPATTAGTAVSARTAAGVLIVSGSF
jgi:hypothetical protein